MWKARKIRIAPTQASIWPLLLSVCIGALAALLSQILFFYLSRKHSLTKDAQHSCIEFLSSVLEFTGFIFSTSTDGELFARLKTHVHISRVKIECLCPPNIVDIANSIWRTIDQKILDEEKGKDIVQKVYEMKRAIAELYKFK